MEWTALENQIMQNRCKLLEMCFQDSLKKPCRMLTSFAVLSPRSAGTLKLSCAVQVLFQMTSESRMLTQAQNQRPTHPN
jgi:hypothetical protein